MQAFMEVVKMRFKSYFQYKWTFAMSFLTQPIIFIIHYIVFQSIYQYGGKASIQGYSMEQMVWFFTANLLVNAFVWNPTVGTMSGKILSGKLTRDLLRPISVFQFEMADCVASRCVSFLVDFLPGLILYSLILPPRFVTVWSFLKFLIVVIPAFFLNYLTAALIGICAMWVKN
nr:ABC-2 family transporter protein [Lachnospiraceae bacterium]